jgi:hypothetical protein
MALVTGLFFDAYAITMGTETPWGQKHHGDRNTMGTETPWGQKHHGDRKAIETAWLRAK